MSAVLSNAVLEQATNKQVLIVEDDPAVLELLAFILENRGYSVSTASDGQAALDHLSENRPNLILLDVSMPKVDGIRVLHRIRESEVHGNTPVVMLSGLAEAHDVTLAMDAGADLYLTKPFSPSEVCLVLDRFTINAAPAPAPAPAKPKGASWKFWTAWAI